MTEIKPFKLTDIGYFLPNKFSHIDRVLDRLIDPAFEVHSLWHDGMVHAILVFQNYWQRNWHGFFLISEAFTPKMGIVLRDYIRDTMTDREALRMQTESISCEELTKWHKFLGFELEGCRRQMLYGHDYDQWAILRGEK